MKHLKHQDLVAAFPYRDMRPGQAKALSLVSKVIGETDRNLILEAPTGVGKTAVGFSFLRTLENSGEGPLFYIVPNKTLVEQIKALHPSVRVAYGRSEHPCLYFPDQELTANEIPCSLLQDCAHRVDQETGETHERGAEKCPYLWHKYQAKVQGGIIVCTTAFYLFTQLFSREFKRPAGLVVDEAHRIASTIRSCLSYEITDWHLSRAIEFLDGIESPEVKHLDRFRKLMVRIVRGKTKSAAATLLEDHEIRELMDILMKIDSERMRDRIVAAIKKGAIDVKEKRDVLRRVEALVYDLGRYYRSFEFALPSAERHPLNYTFAASRKELADNQRVQYWLTIKAYYVAPLIRKLLSPRTLAYSATIGDPDIFGYETGIKGAFHSLESEFSKDRTRIFLPTDTPNLAVKERKKGEPARVIRRLVRAVIALKRKEVRSLVIVVSERERQQFLGISAEEGLDVISYGNGTPARIAALRFKEGEGDALLGTCANYGEGIDLPKGLAEAIFVLRPGYPSPMDPATQFEERRFGSMRWRLWNWRIMIEAMQARGRNIRNERDRGVTFFISQQFRRVVFAAMPKYLEESYRGQQTLDQCIKEAKELLL